MDQLRERFGVKSEFFGSNGGQKFCTRLVFGIVEFFAGAVATKMLGVLRRQKCTLMMVKPPSKQRRTGILEIHNGIFVSVKNPILKRMRGLMGHSRIKNLRVGMNALAVEARKDRGRSRSVETPVMKTKAKLHSCLPRYPYVIRLLDRKAK